MNHALTVAIVGAGSSYTPELLDGFLKLPPGQLPVRAFRLHDIDARRLDIMAGLAERMLRRAGGSATITRHTALEPALDGADYVIAQIRVGGMAARHLDESIPLTYGLLGQETTGPGGMFKALRTIPAMLELAHAVERIAPNAFILNYTNPSGIVTEAVTRHTRARFIGLCSGIPSMIADLQARFAADYPDLACRCVGLNHLGFIHRMRAGDRDVTADILRRLYDEKRAADPPDAEAVAWHALCLDIGALPIGYLAYFFRRGHCIAKLRALERTRAQQIMAIEADIFREAAAPGSDTRPEAVSKRGAGGYSAITFAVMAAIHGDTGAELAVSAPQRGCVEGLEPDEVAELVCRVDRAGATPLPVGPIPLAFRGLVQAVKAYERLTVDAALRREKRLLRQALLNHPLAGDLDVIDPLLNDMLAAHGLAFT